jgi:hypothetical protein
MTVGRHRGMMTNEYIKIGSSPYEKVKNFKYLGSLLKVKILSRREKMHT